VHTEIVFSNNLESNFPPLHILFNYQRKGLQPTNTAIFDKSLPFNVEDNNVSILIAYYVGHHVLLLASVDFYHLSKSL
jgi:hypothetical protein